MSKITFTRITSDMPISKRFTLENGTLQKGSGGNMRSGWSERLEVDDLLGLREIIQHLNVRQALAFGAHAPEQQRVRVTTKAHLHETPDAIARGREYYSFPQGEAGILLLDYDPPKGGQALSSAEGLRDLLISVSPALSECEMLISPSASSFIYKDDGTQLQGLRGMHCFVKVAEGANIPEIGAGIDARCWLHGLGYVQESKSGAKLLRGLVDTSVWQPERLSFDAGADCGTGLVQKRPAPKHWEGRALTLADVALSDDDLDRVEDLKRKERGLEALSSAEKAKAKQKKVSVSVKRTSPTEKKELSDYKKKELLRALYCIPADVPYELWIRLGMSLAGIVGGFEIWDSWSKTASNYPGRDVLQYKFSSFDNTSVGLGTLFHVAKEFGFVHKNATPKLPVREKEAPGETGSLDSLSSAVPVDVARKELKIAVWDFFRAAKNFAKPDATSNPVAPLMAIKTTTGTGKTTQIKALINDPDFLSSGLCAVVVAKDKAQATEYEQAGGYFRHGRENLDQVFFDDKGEEHVIDGFESAKPWHCPHAGKDGPVEKLAESEHLLSEMCRGGHCAHGNQLMLDRAREKGYEPSEVVVRFFREYPELRDRVHPCVWIPHHEQAQKARVRVVVSQGLGSGDLLVKEIFRDGAKVDFVIVDESVEWVHSHSQSLDEIRKTLVRMKNILEKDQCLEEKEKDALAGMIALYQQIPDALASAAKNAAEGEYISAPPELAEIVMEAKEFVKKHGNAWEKAQWSRWTELTYAPLRVAFEIVRAASDGYLSINEGRLNAVYFHPLIEDVAGKIPLQIADATLDPFAEAIIRAKAGEIREVIAQQNMRIVVDPRRFYSQIPEDDKDFDKRIRKEIGDLWTVKKMYERDESKELAVIARRQLAVRILSQKIGMPLKEFEALPNAKKWEISIAHGIGWWGWHDKAHDEWKDYSGILLWGQPPIPETAWADRWEGYRALAIHCHAPGAESLPHWDNKWEKQAWVPVDKEREQLSMCRLPENPMIREFMLRELAALRAQAIGRLRAANSDTEKDIFIVGGAPVAGLGGYGLRIDEFARIVGGMVGWEKKKLAHEKRTQEMVDAAVEVVAMGGTPTREAVQEHMREVCPTSVKDSYERGTNPPESQAVRNGTWSELLSLAPHLARFMQINGRSARLIRDLQARLASMAADAAKRLIFEFQVLISPARLESDLDGVDAYLQDVVNSDDNRINKFGHTAALLLDLLASPERDCPA